MYIFGYPAVKNSQSHTCIDTYLPMLNVHSDFNQLELAKGPL